MAYQIYSLVFEGYRLEPDWGSLPAKSGIYCIYACTYDTQNDTVSLKRVLYIGESSNIQSRVKEDPRARRDIWFQKLNYGEVLCASYAEISPASDRERAEAAMIFYRQPPCNIQYRNNFPFEKTLVETSGRNGFLDSQFTVG